MGIVPEWLLSWDAMLNMTKGELGLISDDEAYLFFEKGMRSKVSHIYKICRKANNKYLKSYDPKQQSRHILYSGANKLYGYAMSKFHSTSWFKWIDPQDFNSNKYRNSNSSIRCVLQIDFEYPKELCGLHNNFLLVPGKIEIKKCWNIN